MQEQISRRLLIPFFLLAQVAAVASEPPAPPLNVVLAADTAMSAPEAQASTPEAQASKPDAQASKSDAQASKSDAPASTPDAPVSVALAAGAISMDPKEQSRVLGLVESKYFGHRFETDKIDQRISRLEELIFGESGATAQPAERIERLKKAAGITSSVSFDSRKTSCKSDALPDAILEPYNKEFSIRQAASALDKRQEAGKEKSSLVSAHSSSLESEDSMELQSYPHLDDLEMLIAGAISRGEPLSARLNALEKRAFGSPSMIPDPSRRIDALDLYVERKLQKNPYLASAQKPSQSSTSASSKTGTATNGSSPQSAASADRNLSGISKQVLSGVANSILNASGLGALGFNPLPGAGPESGSTAGKQTIRKGLFGRAPQKAEEPADLDFDASPFSQKDKSINESSGQSDEIVSPKPPPDTARLSSKVNWCENQVFGRTYAEMHLTDRLRQLCKELRCLAQKSDFELLDNMPAIISAVLERKQSRPAK